METKYLKINPADNVVVAITDLKAGEIISDEGADVVLKEDVPAGHKFALKNFAKGEDVIKYGYPIGHAIEDALAGAWMSDKNLKTNLAGLLEYTYDPQLEEVNAPDQGLTVKGYVRNNGSSACDYVARACDDA